MSIVLSVSPGRALILAGLLSPDHPLAAADLAAYKQIGRGVYPFPLLTFSGTRRKYLVRICDIEATLAQKAADAILRKSVRQDNSPLRKTRGRPRKIAQGSVPAT